MVKEFIADFIMKNEFDFYMRLHAGNLDLVEEMEAEVYKKNLKNGNNRHECSWCSKVCKYLNECLFNNDAYFIYDSNVKERLNDYRKFYGLVATPKTKIELTKNNPEAKWYTNLWNSLEELKTNLYNKKNESLSRNEIDHILWGFTKYPVKVARKK